MKSLLVLAVGMVALLSLHSKARAATLSYTSHANGSWSIYLSGGAENGNFDYFKFRARTLGSSSFLNVNTGRIAGVPRPPGNLFTYRNRNLDSDPLDDPDFKGWAILNPVNTSNELSFEGGPLSGKISTSTEPEGRLFLANLVISPDAGFEPAKVDISLFNEGALVFTTLPEPGSFLLGIGAFIGILVLRPSGRDKVCYCRR